eukprot:12363538-Karenia_brevis.AAC.1
MVHGGLKPNVIFVYARTVLKSGKTPHEERWGIKFGGHFILFGAEVHYKPASPKGSDQLHKYGEKVLS